MWAMPFMRCWCGRFSRAAARRPPKTCTAARSQLVRASAQAEAVQRILPLLDEEEQEVFRHGRNAKPKTVPKSASVAEYAQATALEALFGWLYLKQRYERINELFGIIAEGFKE